MTGRPRLPIPIEHVDVPDETPRSTPAEPRFSCRCATCWNRTGPSTIPRCSRLNLQYRNRLEFAIGRTCSVDWAVRRGRGGQPRCGPPGCRSPRPRRRGPRSVEDALLSMDALATVTPEELRAGLEPLVSGYGAWLDEQEATAASCPSICARLRSWCCGMLGRPSKRLLAGLDHVAADAEALRCFRFMNRVMRDQRIASQVAAERASDPSLSIEHGPDKRLPRRARRPRRGGRSSWRSS